MSLEIKHLAPYVPFELDTKYRLGDVIKTLKEDEVRDKKLTSESLDFCLKFCKPILKPLSDIEDDEENTVESLSKCCYSYVEYLISQHYDVFGLIEKGLAIDVNTLSANGS